MNFYASTRPSLTGGVAFPSVNPLPNLWTRCFECHEVKVQGHTRSKSDLWTWRRHHSRLLRSSSYSNL